MSSLSLKERALQLHKEHRGKIALECKTPVKTRDDLTLAYTPGVAEPCLEIKKDPGKVFDYTAKGNWVGVVTNGTAVLGLGDIGATAGIPVMEGKSILFKSFAGVDAFPICIDSRDPDKVVETVRLIEPVFGGINLEDIKAPECFEIEDRLKKVCHIPVFHDDQHGTAVIVGACIINALKILGKKFSDVTIVINGVGAAGTAIAKHLLSLGTKDIILSDKDGILYKGKPGLNKYHAEMAERTNKGMRRGNLADAMKGADIFIGVSVGNIVTPEMVRSMNKDAVVVAMANPNPEILPDAAKSAGARIVCTGRSDYPNQVNNVLAFPGIFRGALDVRASTINEEMKMAASYTLAGLIEPQDLNENNVVPGAFNREVTPRVAAAVAKAAIETKVAGRNDVTPEMVYEHTKRVMLI